jgi:antitoxin FitA
VSKRIATGQNTRLALKWFQNGCDLELNMPSITVKNIPEDLYERLKQRAEASHRSINSEIIVSIEQAVRSQGGDLDGASTMTYKLREKAKDYRVLEEEFSQGVLGGTSADFVGKRKEAFYRMVAEIVEDLLLANAIQEGEGTENVSREEIAQILDGES